MIKIGFICWRQGGGTSDYISSSPKKSWMKNLKKETKGEYKGQYPFEKALIAAMEEKYNDIEIMFINKFDEKLLVQNDVNFILSLNLLNAWEKSDEEYERVYKIIKDPKMKVYPNLKEQLFLYDKGNYLKYYEKKGIPIAPTFIIKSDRDHLNIINKVKRKGWKSFVLKPHRAYATTGIGLFNLSDKKLEEKVKKYLDKNEKFPAFVCQELIDGFSKFWEIKSYWINGKFRYYVPTHCWSWLENACAHNSEIDYSHLKNVSRDVIKQVKTMGKKVLDTYPKMNKYSDPPLFLRIDFGCCVDNKMDGKKYFLNEIEYAGCGTLTEIANINNAFDIWVREYYNKAKHIYKMLNKNKKSNKKTNRKKNRTKRRS